MATFRDILQSARKIYRESINDLFHTSELAAKDMNFAITWKNLELYLSNLDETIAQWYKTPTEQLQDQIADMSYKVALEKFELCTHTALIKIELEKKKNDH